MKGSRSSSKAVKGILVTDSVCLSCRQTIHLQRRRYAATAAAAVPSTDPTSSKEPSNTPQDAIKSPGLRPAYQLHAGIVLSRPPFLTRELTSFEKAFYLYQRRLNERQALNFMRYFYYKKNTPAEVDWKRKIKERKTPARDIGVYHAFGKEAWNDELLMGDPVSEPSHQAEALLKDAETMEGVGEEGFGEAPGAGTQQTDKAKGEQMLEQADLLNMPFQRPLSRETEADTQGDVRSLDRQGWRTLYLLVKGAGDNWTFPSARLGLRESLYSAAERVIVQAAGPNMNTWVVGNAPIGHSATEFAEPIVNEANDTAELGEKLFFLKARIMAGQANLKDNAFGLSDFKWLNKEEVKEHVSSKYWSAVQDILPER